MFARRVIVFGSDRSFAKQLAVALKAAGGVVEVHESLEAVAPPIDAALVVVHLDGALADAAPALLPRLVGDTRVIAILPRASLAAVVEVMQTSERVAGMLVAEDFTPAPLSAMATRVMAGDIFGVDKMILWGTQVHSFVVGDYQEKSLCIAAVGEYAEHMGVRRKYRESIEQCLDEMLMNALYDAPVDEQGNPLFTELPTKTRIQLRVEQKAVVQYACDGTQFILAVRDAFGTLERPTVLRYLHKCLTQENQIDRKAGGAGLGLYLMANASSSLMFNVLAGAATEAVCRFDLSSPVPQLSSFGFFTERIDAAGRLAAPASGPRPVAIGPHPVERRAPRPATPPPRALVIGLVAAIVVTLGLAVVAAWPRVFGEERTSITVRTVPAGAAIEIEGKNAGTAPVSAGGALVIRGLEVGRPYPVVARLEGHEPRQAVVHPTGDRTEVTLELRALAAVVRIESSPSGASVALDGTLAGVTPLVVSTLPPGAAVSVTIEKTGFHRATTTLDVPGAGKETKLVQPLVPAQELLPY